MSQEEERRAIVERKRNLLLLIARYLEDQGLSNTVDCLAKESGPMATLLSEYVLCDNIDLDTLYLDYTSYYRVKFGKPPLITKRLEATSANGGKSSDNHQRTASKVLKKCRMRNIFGLSLDKPATLMDELDVNGEKTATDGGVSAELSESLIVSQCTRPIGTMEELCEFPRIRPTLRSFSNYTPEWGELANIVCRDIRTPTGKSAPVTWDRVKGLDVVREALIESVITPIKYPKLFDHFAVRPWKCILLHGPPGTGKTMISRALCSEASSIATFFNISASSVMSKWRGDSEKLIRVLFDVAKHFAPSIVFIDEVDSLMSARDVNVEHEASKRFKNEMLTQIDGLEDVPDVFLLASTNLPWDIDAAFLRRFEQKLLLGLPDASIRLAMIRELIPDAAHWSPGRMDSLAALSDGFSGDELRIAAKEAAMNRIRHAISLTNNSRSDPLVHLEPISPTHLQTALGQIKPSSKQLLPKHVQWNNRHNTNNHQSEKKN